jgi:hypothetical protein
MGFAIAAGRQPPQDGVQGAKRNMFLIISDKKRNSFAEFSKKDKAPLSSPARLKWKRLEEQVDRHISDIAASSQQARRAAASVRSESPGHAILGYGTLCSGNSLKPENKIFYNPAER